MNLIFSDDNRRLYAYENSHPSDHKEKWFGRITIKSGNYWIVLGESFAPSKPIAVKALLEIEQSIRPNGDIEELIKILEKKDEQRKERHKSKSI